MTSRGRLAHLVAMTALCVGIASHAGAEPMPLVGDAYADSAAPEARHGSALFLRVSDAATAYVRFDVSAVPAGSTVASAMLSVFVGRLGSPGTVTIHAVDAAWSEDLLTHAQRPTWTAEPVATLDIAEGTSLTDDLIADVTGAVQAWINGAPNHGFVLVGWGGVEVDVVSKEFLPEGRPATLDVVAVPPPPAQ